MSGRRLGEGRRPTATELDLWRRVAATATRLDARSDEASPSAQSSRDRSVSVEAKPAPADMQATRSSVAQTTPRAERAGETVRPVGPSKPTTRIDRRPRFVQPLSSKTPGIDANTARRLKQGRLDPDARIDLHGMTVERAHRALNQFVLSSFAMGRRVVLVITGKGGRRRDDADHALRDYGDGVGVLRAMTPEWLASPPLSQAVVGVYRAHIRHGGDGAYYVYLRKPPTGRGG